MPDLFGQFCTELVVLVIFFIHVGFLMGFALFARRVYTGLLLVSVLVDFRFLIIFFKILVFLFLVRVLILSGLIVLGVLVKFF
jgi:hypothetical protein